MYHYDQDLAILKSLYHYYFINGSTIPYSISKEIINYIDDLIPNFKFYGYTLMAKIISLLHLNFWIVWEMVEGYYREMIHPFTQEIFNLSVDLWAYFGEYYAVEDRGVNKEHNAINH